MFLEVQFLFAILPQQVANFLVIDFKVGGVNQKFFIIGCFNGFEDMFESSWDYSFLGWRLRDALHCVGFATPGLPVGEYGAVVAFQNALGEK